jgi:phosphoribosylformylglycinamidine synthase
MFLASVYVTIKENVLDPQGQAVEGALHSLGFEEASNVRIGKYMELTIDSDDREDAHKKVVEMCEKLLSNPVIEDYRFELSPVEQGALL